MKNLRWVGELRKTIQQPRFILSIGRPLHHPPPPSAAFFYPRTGAAEFPFPSLTREAPLSFRTHSSTIALQLTPQLTPPPPVLTKFLVGEIELMYVCTNNREAAAFDDSYFHEIENIYAEILVEDNGGVEYQNSDVPYLNSENINENENPNNTLPVSSDVSMNEMNNNSCSTNRKRKKSKMEHGNKSSPGCNCKKSECLKLYCECFASGMYCSQDLCGCTDCFNIPLYEDTVEAAKQQILSKNPSAFAPKKEKENGTTTKTTSSAKRRGCKCKQSKCEKNYCECLQAGVACTIACHCQSCNNPRGTRLGNNNYHTPENGMLYNNIHPFKPFPITNTILGAPYRLAPNLQPFHDNDLLYPPSYSTSASYVRAGSSSSSMSNLREPTKH
ncbi:unnamed protein product [Citrullus colocynthis]|uniref:CRC domain-containing protein n=1 Tax=Citrullus colocynthis TaxID=252529 RepID=A0ABP0YVN7_9ROSI